MRVFMLPAALCLLLTLPVAGSAQAQGETIGQIVRWRGTVEVIGPGSPRAVLVGEPVREGEELVTGRDSQVDVAFRDGARLILGPDSHIVLSTYPPTPGDRVVRLLAGIVRVFLAFDGDKDFAVKTATAVAAARSTIWLVALEEKAGLASTAVFVSAGDVAVSDPAGKTEVLLESGFGTDVAAGEAPSAPKRWGQARVDAALRRVTFVGEPQQ